MTSDLRERILVLLQKLEGCATFDDIEGHCPACENRVVAHWALGAPEAHERSCELIAIKTELESALIRENNEWVYILDDRNRELIDFGVPLISTYRGTGASLAEALQGIDPTVYRVRSIHGNCTPEELAAAKIDPVLRKWFD